MWVRVCSCSRVCACAHVCVCVVCVCVCMCARRLLPPASHPNLLTSCISLAAGAYIIRICTVYYGLSPLPWALARNAHIGWPARFGTQPSTQPLARLLDTCHECLPSAHTLNLLCSRIGSLFGLVSWVALSSPCVLGDLISSLESCLVWVFYCQCILIWERECLGQCRNVQS